MDKSPFRTLKLKSGEDIIAKMVNNKKDSIEIERPMILKTMHLVDNMTGQKRETMVLYDWLKATDRIRITLPKDHILLITNCNPDVLKAYEIQKKYDDAPFTMHRPKGNDSDDKPKVGGFNLENILESVREQMKAARMQPEDLDDMSLEEIMEEAAEELHMVDDDRENAEDYGSSFSDWSPDPEDYLT